MTSLLKGNSESAKIYHYMKQIVTPMSNKQIAHDLGIGVLNMASNMSKLRELGYATYTREGSKTFWVCHKERLKHPQEAIAPRKTSSTKLRSSSEIITAMEESHTALMKELQEAIKRELKTAEDTCFNDFLEFRQAKV